MTGKGSKSEAFEVSDSTDWLDTSLPLLAPLESALRCQVCKDFYQTPVITSCSHTFCSACIRRCLSNDGKCPACRNGDQPIRLRVNLVVEELVEAFKNARQQTLEFARRPTETKESGPPGELHSPKRKRDIEEDEDMQRSPSLSKRTRSSGRARQVTKQPLVIIDSEDDGDGDYEPDDGLVACPICQGRMTIQAVQLHIDHCTGEPPKANPTTAPFRPAFPTIVSPSKPIKKPERLGELHYSMVKDNMLRKRMSDQGLLTNGTRPLMERRYTEWLTLWNSNCDAKVPRPKRELLREMDVWERTQGGRAMLNTTQAPGSQIRDKNFDGSAWAAKHDDSFRDLIAAARKKPLAKSKPEPETEERSNAAGESVPPPDSERGGDEEGPTEQLLADMNLPPETRDPHDVVILNDIGARYPVLTAEYHASDREVGITPDAARQPLSEPMPSSLESHESVH